MSNKTYTTPNLRLYIMDDDGRNAEPIGHLNIGSALHPTVLMDGRVMFASFESQGVFMFFPGLRHPISQKI
jgi:hypothetical protein